jgi:hypothetical protein
VLCISQVKGGGVPCHYGMALVDLGRFFLFLNFIHSWQDSLDGGSARRKAASYTQNNTQTQNKRTQTSMLRVAFERAKTFHALDRAATVIGGSETSGSIKRRGILE